MSRWILYPVLVSLIVTALVVSGLSRTTVVIVASGAAVVIAAVAWLLRAGDLVRFMRTVTPMPISYVKDGMRVKLVGELRCLGEPLTAPASERECAGWVLSVYHEGYRTAEASSSGKSPVGAKKDKKGDSPNRYEPQRVTDLVIDDGSGVAIIRAAGHESMLYLQEDGSLKNRIGSRVVQDVERRLSSDGIELAWLGDRGIVYFDEAILHLGSRVAVLGTCRWETGSDGERTLVMEATGKSGGAIVICDDAQVVALNPNNPAPGFRMAPEPESGDTTGTPA